MTERERDQPGGFPARLPSRCADEMAGDTVVRLYSINGVGLWNSKPVLAFIMDDNDQLELGVMDTMQQRTGRGHAQREQQSARRSTHRAHWCPQPVPHPSKDNA